MVAGGSGVRAAVCALVLTTTLLVAALTYRGKSQLLPRALIERTGAATLTAQEPHLCSTPAGKPLTSATSGTAARVAAYQSLLPERALRRGLASMGDPARMRRVVDRLLAGQPITAVVVGGSVSAGAGGDQSPYPTQFFTWINQTFPHPAHALLNRAVSASQSSLFAMCFETFIPQETDLLVIEWAINDPPAELACQENPKDCFNVDLRRAMEQLLRRALALPGRPAVAFLNWWSYLQSRAAEAEGAYPRFYRSAENDFSVLAQYYGLPSLSFRAAAFPLIAANASGFRVHSTYAESKEPSLLQHDIAHPWRDTGHRYLAELLIGLVRATAADLALRPLSEEDERAAHEELLLPMLHNNHAASGSASCLLQRDMEAAAAEASGFEFINERPGASQPSQQKWGWVGREPGAELVLRFNTKLPNSPPDKAGAAGLYYLRSYEGMGVARVTCSGCSCEPEELVLDGHWDQKLSLPQFQAFKVSQHEECRVHISVANQTSSGGYKVKVQGWLLADSLTWLGNARMLHDHWQQGLVAAQQPKP